jgi:hypothetical protein
LPAGKGAVLVALFCAALAVSLATAGYRAVRAAGAAPLAVAPQSVARLLTFGSMGGTARALALAFHASVALSLAGHALAPLARECAWPSAPAMLTGILSLASLAAMSLARPRGLPPGRVLARALAALTIASGTLLRVSEWAAPAAPWHALLALHAASAAALALSVPFTPMAHLMSLPVCMVLRYRDKKIKQRLKRALVELV